MYWLELYAKFKVWEMAFGVIVTVAFLVYTGIVLGKDAWKWRKIK